MKIKKIKKNNIAIILISLLVLVYIIHNIIGFISAKNLYFVNDITTIDNEMDTKALVIKDEYYYLSNYKPKELGNKKYATGSNIITVPKDINLQFTTKYIDDKLNDLEENHNNIKREKYEIKSSDLKSLSDSIRNRKFDNEFLDQYDLNKNITEEEYFHEKKELNMIQKILSSKGSTVDTNVSGVVKNKVDNYENLANYNSSRLLDDDFYIRECEADYLQDGMAISDSTNVALMFSLDNSRLKRNLDKNDEIGIKLKDDTYSAYVKDIKVNKNFVTMVCNLDDGINDFLNKRFVDIKVIDKKSKAYKIPTKSIVERNSTKGVFVKKDSGIVKFVAVKILKSDSKYSYISTGQDGKVEINNKEVKTVNLYDNIVKNPRFVKEGELIE